MARTQSTQTTPFTPLYDDVMKLPDLSLTAKVVLCRILRYHEGDIHPSKGTLAESLSVSVRTIFNALRELQETGYISVTRIGKKLNNRYTLERQKLPITLSAKVADHGSKPCRSQQAKVADPYRETIPDTERERNARHARNSPPSQDIAEIMLETFGEVAA